MTDKEYIKMLKERDKAMPMGRYIWTTEAYKDRMPSDLCGNCGRMLYLDDYVFCPVCGQRIDRDNYKL